MNAVYIFEQRGVCDIAMRNENPAKSASKPGMYNMHSNIGLFSPHDGTKQLTSMRIRRVLRIDAAFSAVFCCLSLYIAMHRMYKGDR